MSSCGPKPVTDDEMDPLDLGGSGKRLPPPFGDDAPDPKIPLERRWIAPGRCRGGVAETGNRPGELGVGACEIEGAKDTVDALALVFLSLSEARWR